MGKFPGWRTMSSAQRYNARAAAMFERSYELKARAAGWKKIPEKDFHSFESSDGIKSWHFRKTEHIGQNPWKLLCQEANIH